MASYRLFLWSRGENRLQEHQVAMDVGVGSMGLLETLDEIGRHAMRDDGGVSPYLAPCDLVAESAAPRRPTKLIRARRHLSAARQLLEDVGEHTLAERTAVPLAELNRRG